MTSIKRFAALLAIAGCLLATAALGDDRPDGDTTRDGLQYHGGPVLTGATHIYYLWYGDWSESLALPILTDFASSLGGSPYYNINTTHHDGAGRHVGTSISYSGSATDDYSLGASLTDAGVLEVVKTAIHRGALPVDANGIYFVLTSADVDETSGFCTDFCSWHHHAKVAGVDLKVVFLGNPARCPSACELVPGNTPNGDAAADAMVAGVAARINETVTNPEADGWYDAAGLENTDKCLLSKNPFGPTYITADGARANLRLGARNFLVPRNWVNADGAGGGHCALRYP
jgi:hypothetical protein